MPSGSAIGPRAAIPPRLTKTAVFDAGIVRRVAIPGIVATARAAIVIGRTNAIVCDAFGCWAMAAVGAIQA